MWEGRGVGGKGCGRKGGCEREGRERSTRDKRVWSGGGEGKKRVYKGREGTGVRKAEEQDE